jgi:butyryl-CoA dehydrogenase
MGTTGKDAGAPPVAIIGHADVRRMLLAQKAYAEGALALALYSARLVDEQHTGDPAAAKDAALLLELLTPIAKSWPSEWCLEANSLAIQVHGGYGYTRDFPVERLYRDNRLNHIHEGAHGIHGLDLLGRKAVAQDGAALKDLFARMDEAIRAVRGSVSLAPCAEALEAAIADATQTTAKIATALRGNPELALANATLYLDGLGHIVVAWRWLVQARAAESAHAAASGRERDFYAGKLSACRYFFRYELPRAGQALHLVRSLDDTALAIPDDGF